MRSHCCLSIFGDHLTHSNRSVFLFLASLLVLLPLNAQSSSSLSLDGKWEFRALTDAPIPQVKGWLPARVPGVVQTDLLQNKLIPDPFYADNEYRLQWVGNADWEYRTTFNLPQQTLSRERVDLVFDGLDTFAEVFVNEHSVLKANNMFRSWRVSAKEALHAGDNSIRIVFHSPIQTMLPYVKKLPYVLPAISTANGGNEEGIATAPYTRKAPYNYGWDWGPRFVTIGVWKSVHLESWDGVRIANLHIHQQKISKDLAQLSASLEIKSTRATSATISISHDGISGKNRSTAATQKVQLEAGINKVSIPLRIDSPRLWYPNGYGAQDRYIFSANVKTDRGQTTASVKTGLRSLELLREPDKWGKSFTFVVNGIPIFAKGANVIPYDSFMDRVTPEIHRRSLQAAHDSHMNMLRAWGGAYYESDDFYDIADELGIMIWQEFMFGGDMVPGDLAFQQNVEQEAIQQVTRLRDHPSVVLWCGNNEVETGWKGWGDRQGFKLGVNAAARERVWQDYVVMFRDILKSVVHEYGDGVPYWPSSPGSNFDDVPQGQENGDMHYWSVWHALEPIENYTQQFPRFMSEFGFQSFPEMKTIRAFTPPDQMDIRSTTLQSHQKNKGGNERILTYMLREYHEPKDFASFVYLSQVQQAEAIKVGAEHLRRQRPRTMGSLYWQLNDCWPVASWASIDYYGNWKALQFYAKRFYADVLVSPFAHDGKIEVFVVSDKLQPLTAQLRTRVLDFSGKAISDISKDISVPALSSTSVITVDEAHLVPADKTKNVFAVFDLSVGGKVVSTNTWFFDRMRNLDLPANPGIQTDVRQAGNATTITLTSPQLARHVFVSFGDLDAQLSDNYVDLIPNQPVTIDVTSKASADDLKKNLQVQHMMQAFLPAEGAH